MEQLRQMREIEKEYKNYYLSTGFQTSEEALDMKELTEKFSGLSQEYRHLFPGVFSDALMEDDYFQEQQDISVIQHYRYLPAVYHEHDFFELACVLSGSVINFIGKQKFELYPGDVFILTPHSQHAVCTYYDDTVMINILIRSSTFEQHFLKILPDNELLFDFFIKTLYGTSDTPYLLFKTGDDPALTSYILQLIHEYRRNKRYKNTLLSSLLSIFFVTLLRNHEKDVIIPIVKSSVMNENLIFILQYMQKHYTTITLSHLAEFFNYSERQIQRIITTATGLSFSENIKKLRMNHAADLLKKTNLSVREIAELTGYYDASNFRHLFKEYFGETPKHYRNKISGSTLGEA